MLMAIPSCHKRTLSGACSFHSAKQDIFKGTKYHSADLIFETFLDSLSS